MKILASLVILPFLMVVSVARAQTMTNSSFKIEMGNLDSIAGESSGSNYNLNITSGENAPGQYSGTNYTVKAGFQYLPRTSPFSFSISSTLVDFGTLSPTNPIERTTTLTISNTSAPTYQVSVSENHQLYVPKTGAIIPDTTCDDGKCSDDSASNWSSSLTYGFGYRCDSASIISNAAKSDGCMANDLSFFKNPSFYKQFADVSKSEKAQMIIVGDKGKNQKASVTYKVNISSSQATGLYTNAVNYIATPGF